MKRKREEIKAVLMSQEWVEAALQAGESRLSLTQIKDLALGVRQQVGQTLTKGLTAQQVEQEKAALPDCPTCGKSM